MLIPTDFQATASGAVITIQASPSAEKQTIVVATLLLTCAVLLVMVGVVVFLFTRRKGDGTAGGKAESG